MLALAQRCAGCRTGLRVIPHLQKGCADYRKACGNSIIPKKYQLNTTSIQLCPNACVGSALRWLPVRAESDSAPPRRLREFKKSVRKHYNTKKIPIEYHFNTTLPQCLRWLSVALAAGQGCESFRTFKNNARIYDKPAETL